MERRQAILLGSETPTAWSATAPDRRAQLVTAAGEEEVRSAERALTLFHIDRCWRDHLSLAADVREGIHLVALGGADPLTRFSTEIIRAFERIDDAIDQAVLGELDRLEVAGGRITVRGVDLKGPSSTWTYIVNEEPFRNQIGAMLTGPGGKTVAIYAAVVLMPLLIAWGLVDTFLRRRPGRRPDPFRGRDSRETEGGN